MTAFVFEQLLPLTLAGSAVALLLLAFSPLIGKKLGSCWLYYSWVVPLLLFTLPVSAIFKQKTAPALLPATPFAKLAPVQFVGEMLNSSALPPEAATPLPWRELLAVLWVAGMVLFLLHRLRAAVRFTRTIQHASLSAGADIQTILAICKAEKRVRQHVPVLICPLAGSPMLVGAFSPCIILPDSHLGEDDLRLIFMHELTHLRHGDLFYKLAALLVNAVHWFNPVCWMITRRLNSLCELACDESLVGGLGREERRQYGTAILNMMGEVKLAPPVSTSFSLRKEDLKRRLGLMMDCKKTTKVLFCAGVCSLTLLSYVGISVYAYVSESPSAAASTSSGRILNSADTQPRLISLIPPVEDAEVLVPVSEEHTGIDYKADQGTPILAAAAGRVVFISENNETAFGRGNNLVIDHGNGQTTRYGHCSKILVKKGQTVAQGEKIAEVGTTGFTTIPKCHFELWLNNEFVPLEDYRFIQSAKDRAFSLTESVVQSLYVDSKQNKLLLTIPSDTIDGTHWSIQVSGRIQVGKEAASAHWFEAQTASSDWKPGKIYSDTLNAETLLECEVFAALLDKDGKEIASSTLTFTPAPAVPAPLLNTAGTTDAKALTLLQPVKDAKISVGFGAYKGHTGIDFTMPGAFGKDILAAADGMIVRADQRGGYGNLIIIDHGNGFQTLYGHCDTFRFEIGAGDPAVAVKAGDVIGTVGKSGNVTGVMCHFELHKDGVVIDPTPFLL